MTYSAFESNHQLPKTPRRTYLRPDRPRSARHLLSAKNIDVDELDRLCAVADSFEQGAVPLDTSSNIVALLFFQASTRTRMGFAAAALGLHCQVIGFDDMSSSRSNARTGESLEDCSAVVSQLCDLIVVRHHEVGAAERMSATSRVPVVNAGDGWNEHPTQALIDIFALRRGLGAIRGASIAFGGDPRGRTVRSLIQLLRYEGPREVIFCPPPHYAVPEDITRALAQSQIRYRTIHDIKHALRDCDAIMMAPYDMSDIGEPSGSGYISPRKTPDSHVITRDKIELIQSEALLYHPMPRQDELDRSCDDLPNAMYFEQVRLSKFMRMAVLDSLLDLH